MANRIRLTTAVMLFALIPQLLVAAEHTAQKVVYHLDAAANARWAMLLARAHLSQNERARIVIVAHTAPGSTSCSKTRKTEAETLTNRMSWS